MGNGIISNIDFMKALKQLLLKIIYTLSIGLICTSCGYFSKPNNISKNSSENILCVESRKGELLYTNNLTSKLDVQDWIMEGPGEIEFHENAMHMYSPHEEGHHVFWCPKDFPDSFIAQWELQNQEIDAGLCIIFFSAQGNKGESIFHNSFPPRNGVFKQYTKSKHFNNYHISYYANGKDNRAREIAHLRKNSGFHKVQVGDNGIPLESTGIHKITLMKKGAHICCFVDERKVIDWTDDGKEYGAVLKGGKIGFRQMKWTHFKYRNFKVWKIEDRKNK